MTASIDAAVLAEIVAGLRARRAALHAELSQDRDRTDSERIGQYAGEVHDRGEESSVGAQSEINSAVMGHHQLELAQVEQALARIEAGTFGICVVCGDEIEAGRLRAHPTAVRCHGCQSRAEGR